MNLRKRVKKEINLKGLEDTKEAAFNLHENSKKWQKVKKTAWS